VAEKHTAKALARLFGFDGHRAGGFTTQGGSASNLTSLVIARNTLYPSTKTRGNSGLEFALFTSAHGHYSVEKAAVACGMGSAAVWTVPVDGEGRMTAEALRGVVAQAREAGKTPLYVNATAGTTVLGSFDPFDELADVAAEHGLWLHIDASWGGCTVFSARHRERLAGAHRANSLAVNPHKMLNVPLTCSFLLGPDLSVFHRANTLPAGYLFHSGGENETQDSVDEPAELWDLADMTMQCGRRGDSLKLALSWTYYGTSGLERQVDTAFTTAAYLATLLADNTDFLLISTNPPPCLQVCFYYTPGGVLPTDSKENTRRTRDMVHRLVPRGFMIDYAPGDKGSFFRVVVNLQTLRGTVDGLVKALEDVGREILASNRN
jgi:glutamate decarboxylase